MSDTLIDTAKFKLYRTAKSEIDAGTEAVTYEDGTEDLVVGSETKKVVQVGEEMTTSGGKITIPELSYAPDGTYYLLETKAPDGYIIIENPTVIHLTLTDEYRDYIDPYPVITDIKNGLESGRIIMELNGKEITLLCELSERQRSILYAGGLLNLTREENK